MNVMSGPAWPLFCQPNNFHLGSGGSNHVLIGFCDKKAWMAQWFCLWLSDCVIFLSRVHIQLIACLLIASYCILLALCSNQHFYGLLTWCKIYPMTTELACTENIPQTVHTIDYSAISRNDGWRLPIWHRGFGTLYGVTKHWGYAFNNPQVPMSMVTLDSLYSTDFALIFTWRTQLCNSIRHSWIFT